MKFETTSLWQSTLGKQGDDVIDHLRVTYLALRNNIKGLLEEVRVDFPNLTVHSIEHADDLWRLASLIVGKEYAINPLDGFILGCSFLVHDSVLSYKAFGGKEALRSTSIWNDYYQDIVGTEYDTEEGKHKIDFKVIRYLHANSCMDILLKKFNGLDGASSFLLADETIRNHYGELIGKIAASHHWEADRLQDLPKQVNALDNFPEGWTIHPQKLACILRCADAAAIDSGRAPDYLFRLLKLNGLSKDHWIAQNRIGIALNDENPSQLLISSTHDFEEKDFAAWNVAYDAVKVIESEIEKCQDLLPENDRFQIKSVAGANSRKALSGYIRTRGWTPSDVNVHISDVAKLITTLGGKELYGQEDHILIVLRELIQNARDAIKARKALEGEDSFSGKIQVTVNHTDKGTLLSVIDNGVGMSLETISNSLLNFGNSFWHEDDVVREFPGLKAKGFRSIGQFGIGFFSVFMIAKTVEIETRRFRDGLDNAHLVKFPAGLTLSPIFANYTSPTTAYSTKISLLLEGGNKDWPTEYEVKRNLLNSKNFKVPFSAILTALVSGLDVDVYLQELGATPVMIHQRIDSPHLDKRLWLRALSLADYQHDKELDRYIDENFDRLRYIDDENHIFAGLAAIGTRFNPSQDFLSGATVGGLLTEIHSRNSEFWIGIIEKHPGGAKRGGGAFVISQESLQTWALDQLSLIGPQIFTDIQSRFRLQIALQYFKTDPIDIAIARCIWNKNGIVNRGLLSLDSIVQRISDGHILIFVESSFSSNKVNEGHGDIYFGPEEVATNLLPNEILYVPVFNSSFLSYKLNGGVPVNDMGFVDCLYRKADAMGVKLNFSFRDNYVKNSFGYEERALVISC